MMAILLDGRELSKKLNRALKAEVASWPRKPGLAVVLVGADPASEVYVRRKGVVAGRLGFSHRQIDLPAEVSQSELLGVVADLNADDSVDGILVQLPLPEHLDAHAVMGSIAPEKDVDGFTAVSAGLLSQGRPHLVPCTPKGVMVLLKEAGVDLSGKHAVIIGRSNIVGRPMAQLLEQANCTVTVCHSRTLGVEAHVRAADVIVAAVGRPAFVQGDWVKDGAVVIDVGINRLDDGTLVGDVDTDPASAHASAITPVPGGVGPMTIAMLMANTARACRARLALDDAR